MDSNQCLIFNKKQISVVKDLLSSKSGIMFTQFGSIAWPSLDFSKRMMKKIVTVHAKKKVFTIKTWSSDPEWMNLQWRAVRRRKSTCGNRWKVMGRSTFLLDLANRFSFILCVTGVLYWKSSMFWRVSFVKMPFYGLITLKVDSPWPRGDFHQKVQKI